MASHYLDQIPLDFTNPAVKELRRLLSDTYFRSADVIALVQGAGASPAAINWDQPMVLVWHEVLFKLQNQDRLRALLLNLIDGPDRALAERLRELTAEQPVTEAPSHPATDRGLAIWEKQGGRERITGPESTLLDVSFLRRGTELASAVARLLVELDGVPYYGTAFRIGADLMLTNHHVLFADSGNPATGVNAWFGFERSFDGKDREPIIVPGRIETITGDPVHDWATFRLAGLAPGGTAVISLTGAAPVTVDDRVYIIQHPNGGVKKIGMVHNVVRYVDDDVIRYLTDTDGGSSGSPVFNEQWQLVALHHQWIEDKTGRTTEIRNQGRRIERVAAGLSAAGIA
jgi:hypothetical protein